MKNKKVLALLIVGVLLITGSALLLKNRNNSPAVAPVEKEPKIDLSPATEEDKKRADQHKEDIVKQQEQASQTPSADHAVTPIIISSSYSNNRVTVRSFIPSLVEDNGTCTLTLSKDGQTLTKQASAIRNAQTTDCPPMSFERSEIPNSGSWKVVVTYKSPVSSGTSSEGAVEVQ